MAKRITKVNKYYTNEAGDRANSPTEDVIAVGFDVYDLTNYKEGADKPILENFVFELSALPEANKQRCMAMGVAQKVGDAYAGADTAEILETIPAMFERLQGGEWNTSKGSGGPRIGTLVEAITNMLAEKGVDVTEEIAKKIHTTLLTEEGRAQAMANAQVAAEVARITAERAAKKAQEAAARAGEAGDESDTFMKAFT